MAIEPTLGRLPQKTAKKRPVDWDMVAKLASIQCSAGEVADVMGWTYEGLCRVSQEVFKRPLDEVLEVWRNYGRSSLRRTQWTMAQKSPQMAIWLGKQYLKQKDAHSLEHSGGVATNVVQYGDKPALTYEQEKAIKKDHELLHRKEEVEARIEEVNKPYYEKFGYPDDERDNP